jgi:hypothetical protein
VYGFPELKQGQGTAGSVWVVDEGNGAQANAKAIIIGSAGMFCQLCTAIRARISLLPGQ